MVASSNVLYKENVFYENPAYVWGWGYTTCMHDITPKIKVTFTQNFNWNFYILLAIWIFRSCVFWQYYQLYDWKSKSLCRPCISAVLGHTCMYGITGRIKGAFPHNFNWKFYILDILSWFGDIVIKKQQQTNKQYTYNTHKYKIGIG